jgi:hypothetical protein
LRRACAAQLRWATRASHAARPRSILGLAGSPWRCTFNATSSCSLGAGSSSGRRARRRGRRRPRGRPDRRDRDTIGIGCDTPSAVELGRGTRPAVPTAVDGRARSRACPTPILVPSHVHASPLLPPPARAAAVVDGHDRGRHGSPTRCSCWAVRLATSLRSSRPRRSLWCWHGLPATLPRPLPQQGPQRPPPSAGRSGRVRRCQPGRGQPRRAQ